MSQSLHPETINALSFGGAAGFIRTVADQGGETHDLMTALTAMAARVIGATIPEHADPQTVEMFRRMVGEMLALRREIDRDEAAVHQ